MEKIIKRLNKDKEVPYLKERCHELTGEWIPFHWDCFKDIEEYKDYMRKVIDEHDTAGQKG